MITRFKGGWFPVGGILHMFNFTLIHSMVARNVRASPISPFHVHWRRAQSSVRGMRGQAGPRARNHAVQAARITAFAGVIILTRTLAARVAWVQHARHEAAINSYALLMAAGLHGPAGQLVHRPVVEAPARARVIAPAHHRSTVAKHALAKTLRQTPAPSRSVWALQHIRKNCAAAAPPYCKQSRAGTMALPIT